MKWRVPDDDVDQRRRGVTSCKDCQACRTGRMLWVAADRASWRIVDDHDSCEWVFGWMFLLVPAHPGSPG